MDKNNYSNKVLWRKDYTSVNELGIIFKETFVKL